MFSKKLFLGVFLNVLFGLLIPSISIAAGAAIPNPACAGASASGEAMPVGDISGWHQIYADNFNYNVALGDFPTAVSDKWTGYKDGWPDTTRNGHYYPSKVISVHDCMMDMYIHTSSNGIHMVAGPSPKLPKEFTAPPHHNCMLYGRYAVRFKSDLLPGYKTAWLLWPQSGIWPEKGEIEYPEGTLGPKGTIAANLHNMGDTQATKKTGQQHFRTTAKYTSWHTAVMEWSPQITNFYLDNQLIGSTTQGIPSKPMRWVLQTETDLKKNKPPDDSVEGHIYVAWVAVYSMK